MGYKSRRFWKAIQNFTVWEGVKVTRDRIICQNIFTQTSRLFLKLFIRDYLHRVGVSSRRAPMKTEISIFVGKFCQNIIIW